MNRPPNPTNTPAHILRLAPGLEGKSRNVVLAIALVAGFAELAYAVMNLSAMPVYLKFSMGFEASRIAVIGTAFLLCEGVMKGPFGIIGDRIGRKKLIIIGPLISVFTSLLTVLVHSEHWLVFALLRALDGLGAAALWPAALAMIADMVEEERRSQAMSLFNVMYLMGVAIGPLLGGFANGLAAWAITNVFHGKAVIDPRTASFYLISLLFAITAFAAWWKVPDIRNHQTTAEHEQGFNMKALMETLRKSPENLALAFVTFLGVGLILLLIKLFAMAEFGISEIRYGSLLLIPSLVVAFASLPLGTLGDRIGKIRAVRIGIGLCALSMWSLALIHNEVALVIGGSLIGVGFVMAFPSWMAHISASCDPRQRGAVMGAVGTAQGLGAMTGALMSGYLYEHANIPLPFIHAVKTSHYVPFIGCAVMLLIAWILTLTTLKERPVS